MSDGAVTLFVAPDVMLVPTASCTVEFDVVVAVPGAVNVDVVDAVTLPAVDEPADGAVTPDAVDGVIVDSAVSRTSVDSGVTVDPVAVAPAVVVLPTSPAIGCAFADDRVTDAVMSVVPDSVVATESLTAPCADACDVTVEPSGVPVESVGVIGDVTLVSAVAVSGVVVDAVTAEPTVIELPEDSGVAVESDTTDSLVADVVCVVVCDVAVDGVTVPPVDDVVTAPPCDVAVDGVTVEATVMLDDDASEVVDDAVTVEPTVIELPDDSGVAVASEIVDPLVVTDITDAVPGVVVAPVRVIVAVESVCTVACRTVATAPLTPLSAVAVVTGSLDTAVPVAVLTDACDTSSMNPPDVTGEAVASVTAPCAIASSAPIRMLATSSVGDETDVFSRSRSNRGQNVLAEPRNALIVC